MMTTDRLSKTGATTIIFTGAAYFAMVFTLAFATGIARVLVVEPRLGPMAAVLLEVPVLVVASWIVARRLFRCKYLAWTQRAAAGFVALTFTLASEVALAYLMRGTGVVAWVATVATPPGIVGQLAFAAIPIFVRPQPMVLALRR